jgi:dihydroflavonol-4-reductase
MEEQRAFWSGRKVALTGATGFLGHHLARALASLGAHVVALVRSSARGERLAAGVRREVAPLDEVPALARACSGCEYVFHLAGAVDFGEDWERLRAAHVEGTRNLLAAARAAGVRRVVHTSSIVAVGASREPHALDENAVWNLGRHRVPYVTTKRQAEEIALAANGTGLEVVVINPSCIVGPDDFRGSEFGTLCRRFWRGRVPFYFGGGNNFVDVRDVVRGQLLAAERGRPGQRYLLTGQNRTFQSFYSDLARAARHPIFRLRLPTALAVFGAELAALFRRRRNARPYLSPGQARLLGLYFFYDCSRARRELGYQARPLKRTLADAYAFWMGRGLS